MAKLKKLRWKAEFFCQPAYKNVACVSIRDLDIFGNNGAMSSFLRIEMFINFQVNDNLYQAHQCGYCGDNSGRVSPENENSQWEYAVDEQEYDNQADIVSFGADERHGNGRIATDDSGYPGKSRNKKRETQNDEHKDRQKPCKIRRYEQSQIGQTKPFVKFGKGFEGAGKEKQNFETDFKREQRCKGQQQNRQHSNQCVAETAPAEKRLPSEIKTDKEVIEEICVDEVGKHNRQVGRDAQLLSIVNRTIGEKEKKCRQQNVPTHENQAAAY